MERSLNIDALVEMRSDGQGYAQQYDEAYAKMTPEEQAEEDALMELMLHELGDDDDGRAKG